MTPEQSNTPVQITRTPVASKLLSSIGYDEASQTLEVQFAKSGAVYQYRDVSPSIYAQLVAADSLGSHFLSHIKDNHAFTRMDS